MTWIFGSFLVTPCALTSCHVISKQGDDSSSGHLGPTGVGRRPRDNHAVRFRQSAENREPSQGHAADQRVRSSLMIRLVRGCKRWHPMAPGRRYGARRSPLSEYMSLHLSLKLPTNSVLLSRIKWEIYFYKEVFRSFLETCSLYLIMFFVVHKDTTILFLHIHDL